MNLKLLPRYPTNFIPPSVVTMVHAKKQALPVLGDLHKPVVGVVPSFPHIFHDFSVYSPWLADAS